MASQRREGQRGEESSGEGGEEKRDDVGERGVKGWREMWRR